MLVKILISFVIAMSWNANHIPSAKTDENKIAWHENNQLSWGDYQGRPILHGRFNAESSLQISYRLGITRKDDDVKVNFTVKCLFDKESSWVNPKNKTNTLLEHEQLHFDIAEVYARRLRRKLSESEFTIKNYRSKSSDIFDDNFKDYQKIQVIYDRETNHGLTQRQQAIWKAKINRLLKKSSGYKKD